MSSLGKAEDKADKFPDWDYFSERPDALGEDLLSPAAEMAATVQLFRADLETAGQRLIEARGEGLKALAEQAVLVAQLTAALELYEPDFTQAALKKPYRHLRVLKDQMLDELRRAGLTVVDPLGQPFDEVAALVQVIGWRHHERYNAEVVAEVMESIVTCEGELVRPGRVIMGAPPQEAQPEQTASVAADGQAMAAAQAGESDLAGRPAQASEPNPPAMIAGGETDQSAAVAVAAASDQPDQGVRTDANTSL
jgi:molecular chaperone GrpE (heat shock protein)